MSTEADVLNSTQALVRVNGVDAAELRMIATDEFHFSYLEEYLAAHSVPISLALPLTKTVWKDSQMPAFFDNLLFEGFQMRLAERKYGLDRRSTIDRFRLLLVTGQVTLGPISVHPMVNGKPVDSIEIEDAFTDDMHHLPLISPYDNRCPICLGEAGQPHGHRSCRRKLWGHEKRIQMEVFRQDPINTFRVLIPGQSVSGAQRKALFHLDAKGNLQRVGKPDYIIKPSSDLPELPANEHLTMAAAAKIGFIVPPVGLYHLDQVGLVFVIQNFIGHQARMSEDFAQLCGQNAEEKNSGTMEALVSTMAQHVTSPAIENAELFRRILFCLLVGNGDTHLKNWSLMVNQKGLVKLAPIYDFLNVRASYAQEQVETVLSIGQKQNDISHQDLIQFCTATLALPEDFAQAVFAEIPAWVTVLTDFCQHSALSAQRKNRYLEIVESRARRFLSK